jgi:hypothetical protein
MSCPRISVLLPVHEPEPRMLRQAVASILRQSLPDLELICVDDGSSATSAALTASLGGGDGRFRYCRVERGGISRALNHGASLAGGRYLARMDADDISLPGRFEAQVALVESGGFSVVGARSVFVDPGLRPFCVLPTSVDPLDIREELRGKLRTALVHSGLLIRRDHFEAVGGYRPEYDGAEDFDLLLRLDSKGQMTATREVLHIFRHHLRSVTHQASYRGSSLVAQIARAHGLPSSVSGPAGAHPSTPAAWHFQWAEVACYAGFQRTALWNLVRSVGPGSPGPARTSRLAARVLYSLALVLAGRGGRFQPLLAEPLRLTATAGPLTRHPLTSSLFP